MVMTERMVMTVKGTIRIAVRTMDKMTVKETDRIAIRTMDKITDRKEEHNDET